MKIKTSIAALMILAFCSCSKESDNGGTQTAKTITETPNVKEFSKIAEAIDNIDPNSQMALESQMANYLNVDNESIADFKVQFEKNSIYGKNASGGSDGVIDLDQQLEAAGFTDIQKEFASKVTALYPAATNNDIDSDDV